MIISRETQADCAAIRRVAGFNCLTAGEHFMVKLLGAALPVLRGKLAFAALD